MGIKARLLRLRDRFRRKEPNKLDLLKIEIESKLELVAGGLERLMEENWNILRQDVSDTIKAIENEKALRKSQGKRANDKFKEEMKTITSNFKAIDDSISKLNDIVNKKSAKVSHMIEKFEWALNNFEKIDSLARKAAHEYETYLDNLKKDISEFKKNDNAVVRLSSLETRITMLELGHKDKAKVSNVHAMENRIGS